MNAHAFFPKVIPGTRHRFTVGDVARLAEAGVTDPERSTELIDGDLIEMPSEGVPHITFKLLLLRWLNRSLNDEWWVVPDATLYLGPEDAPEPDMYIVPALAELKPIDPKCVAAVIEISDSSIAYDLSRKAERYASFGLNEYWVVDINARQTHILTNPSINAYSDIVSVPFSSIVFPRVIPTLTIRFDDLVPPPAA